MEEDTRGSVPWCACHDQREGPVLHLGRHPSTPLPYFVQVESDIAPYKGLLLGLFFMSVGMEISAQLFINK